YRGYGGAPEDLPGRAPQGRAVRWGAHGCLSNRGAWMEALPSSDSPTVRVQTSGRGVPDVRAGRPAGSRCPGCADDPAHVVGPRGARVEGVGAAVARDVDGVVEVTDVPG